VSGLLLGVSFWRPDQGWLAWIALVPLAVLLRCPIYRTELYLGTFLGGVAFDHLGLDYFRTDGYGMASTLWVLMSYALAPFFVGAFWCARVLVRRAGLPAAVALPAAWVSMECVRWHLCALFFDFGFPFLLLGTTQVKQIQLIQIADLVGVSGVGWLVASVNGALADLGSAAICGPRWLRRLAAPLAWVGIPLISAWCYGTWRLGTTVNRPGPTVALMPGILPTGATDEIADEVYAQINAACHAGHSDGLTSAPYPDLVIWGEDAYGSPFAALADDPGADPDERIEGSDALHLEKLARRLQAVVVLGVCRKLPRSEKPQLYNSSVCFAPDGGYSGSFDKLRLGPLLEFQPRIGRILSALSGRKILHPDTLGNGELTPGSRFPVFGVATGAGGPVRHFACSICYDLWFPEVFRNYFDPGLSRQVPDFFVNSANETMAQNSGSSAYAAAALAAARFRSIECRRALVRCCGDGASAVIDSSGSVLVIRGGSDQTKGIIVATVPLDERKSPYTTLGESFALALTFSVAVYLVVLAVRRMLTIAQ